MHSLIDFAGCILVIIGKDKKVTFINKKGCEVLEYRKEEIIGKDWFEDFLPSEVKEKVREVLEKLIKEEAQEVEYFENPVLTKRGEKRYILWHNTPLKDERGRIKGTLSTGIDITDRKKVEEKLKEAQMRAEIIANSTRDAIVITDDDGKVTFWNKAAEKIFGYTENEVIGERIYHLIVPEKYHENVKRGFEEFKKAGKGPIVEKIIEVFSLRKDKKEVPVELSLSSVNMEGKWHAVGIARDIARRKRMEEALKKYQDRLKRLHETVDFLQRCNTEDEVYKTTINEIKKVLGFDFCFLYLMEDESLVLKAASSSSTSEEVKCLLLDRDIAEKTLKEGKSIWTKDVKEFDREATLTSFISSPIDKLGVLQVVSPEAGAFTREDVELIEILTNHLTEEIKRIRLEKKLRDMAIHDPLTGTYNRYYFNEILSREIKRSKRYKYPIGFLMIDINRFKEVNDRFSHLLGDKVLKEVASLIKRNVRNTDIVVRFGGDEFLVLLLQVERKILNKIKERIKNEVKVWGKKTHLIDFPLTLAIGVSFWYPGEKRKVEEVLKEADFKMYEDKKAG